jgi:hypothetical protein
LSVLCGRRIGKVTQTDFALLTVDLRKAWTCWLPVLSPLLIGLGMRPAVIIRPLGGLIV